MRPISNLHLPAPTSKPLSIRKKFGGVGNDTKRTVDLRGRHDGGHGRSSRGARRRCRRRRIRDAAGNHHHGGKAGREPAENRGGCDRDLGRSAGGGRRHRSARGADGRAGGALPGGRQQHPGVRAWRRRQSRLCQCRAERGLQLRRHLSAA